MELALELKKKGIGPGNGIKQNGIESKLVDSCPFQVLRSEGLIYGLTMFLHSVTLRLSPSRSVHKTLAHRPSTTRVNEQAFRV